MNLSGATITRWACALVIAASVVFTISYSRDLYKERNRPFFVSSMVPSLVVKDLAESVTFYRDVLGFSEVADSVASAGRTGVQMRLGDLRLNLRAGAALAQADVGIALPNAAVIPAFHLQIADINAFYQRIESRVEVVERLRNTGDRAEFAIRDCNGFILTFTEKRR